MFKLDVAAQIQIVAQHDLRTNAEVIQVPALQKVPVDFLVSISELKR